MSDQPEEPSREWLLKRCAWYAAQLAATHTTIRALRDKFQEYRDAPMEDVSLFEVHTVRKTLNVVVCEMDRALSRLLGDQQEKPGMDTKAD